MRGVENKVAFITGGGSGIGLGMAQVFLRNGMKVIVADVNQSHLEEAALQLSAERDNVHFVCVNVTDRTAMARAADEAERVFGSVHVLCNNAGINGSISIDVALYDEWDRVMGVNVGGVVNGLVAFVPRMKAHGEGGHIVNTASMAGLIPMPPQAGIYSASKYAVLGLTESLRLALAPFNIGVSALCPGLTRSRIHGSEQPENGAAAQAPAASRQATDLDSQILALMEGGMAPEEVGERVLKGIQNNDRFILPHGEFRDEVRELYEQIAEFFPGPMQSIDPRRLAFEEIRRKITAQARRVEPLRG